MKADQTHLEVLLVSGQFRTTFRKLRRWHHETWVQWYAYRSLHGQGVESRI